MIKGGIETPSFETVFVRQSVFHSRIRLDGRGIHDYRNLSIELSRSEQISTAEVQLGSTLVTTVVTGEIVSPYPDRPVEGILQFNAEISTASEINGLASWEITRLLERSIRESDAIDTESLCIVGGEKVWLIRCEVRVLDSSGGNVHDACILSAMAALRAFRKPEVSLVPNRAADESSGNTAGSKNNAGGSSNTTAAAAAQSNPSSSVTSSSAPSTATGNVLLVHDSSEREPLPLALHHTPLSVTIGVFYFPTAPTTLGVQKVVEDESKKLVLICDPSSEEEKALDGKISFAINAHKEVCAISKPGGLGLHARTIVQAAHLAHARADQLHHRLEAAIAELEQLVLVKREQKLETMRKFRALQEEQRQKKLFLNRRQQDSAGEMDVDAPSTASAAAATAAGITGIDRSDPILQWSKLHEAAGLWEH